MFNFVENDYFFTDLIASSSCKDDIMYNLLLKKHFYHNNSFMSSQ